MSVETELKTRVESHEAVRAQLARARAVFVRCVLETNRLFDDDDGRLYRDGCGLRVRSVEALDGDGGAATITFKGPRQSGMYKVREELESAVGDPAAVCALLDRLGYRERIVFEKRRETWRLGDCTVELDTLPRLGCFVEIEGPDEAAVTDVASRIGLGDAGPIMDSYVSMVADLLGADGSKRMELRFLRGLSGPGA